MVERLVRDQEAVGSSPAISTTKMKRPLRRSFCFGYGRTRDSNREGRSAEKATLWLFWCCRLRRNPVSASRTAPPKPRFQGPVPFLAPKRKSRFCGFFFLYSSLFTLHSSLFTFHFSFRPFPRNFFQRKENREERKENVALLRKALILIADVIPFAYEKANAAFPFRYERSDKKRDRAVRGLFFCT